MGDFYIKDANKQFRKLGDLTPDTMKEFLELDRTVFKDGALSSKIKEPMAITAAHVALMPVLHQGARQTARAARIRK